MKKSNFLSLDQKDWIKGLIMAVAMGAMVAFQDVIERGEFNFDMIMLKKVGIASLAAAFIYLNKNFFTNHKDQLLRKGKNPKVAGE